MNYKLWQTLVFCRQIWFVYSLFSNPLFASQCNEHLNSYYYSGALPLSSQGKNKGNKGLTYAFIIYKEVLPYNLCVLYKILSVPCGQNTPE